MPAFILSLLFPIGLILVSKRTNKDRYMSRGEIILRYIVYSGCLFFLSTVIMSVMKDDNTSFWEKLTNSPGFALKYICLQAAITMGIAVSEWLIFARRITDSLNKDKW